METREAVLPGNRKVKSGKSCAGAERPETVFVMQFYDVLLYSCVKTVFLPTRFN